MLVKGIIWAGVSVDDRAAMRDFFSGRLGLDITTDVPGFTQLTASNGDRLELFGPDSAEHDQLDTGPVAGFWVDDVEAAHAELAEVTEVTDIERGADGHGWFYFTDPEGRYFEACEHPRPRPPRRS